MSVFDRFVKRVTLAVSQMMDSRAVYLPVNYENIVQHGYRKNELIYACTERISNTASQVRLEVFDDKTGVAVPGHPLAKLIRQPNPHITEFDFWLTNIATLWLAGDSYWEIERSGSGMPVALWYLFPHYMELKPSSKEKDGISHFEYAIPGEKAQPLDKQDVLWFRGFDPLNLYRGWPRAAVAARVGAGDNEATDYLTAFWQRGGIPSGILKSRMRLNDRQVEDIRRRWQLRYGGAQKWVSGPAVLDSDAEYQQIAMDFNKMNLSRLDERAEVRICMAMDVPPLLVGATIGLLHSKYDNVNAVQKMWWENTVMPLYEHLDDQMSLKFMRNFGQGITLRWNYSRVPALQETVKMNQDMARERFQSGGITLDEYRLALGLPRDASGNGGRYWWQLDPSLSLPGRTETGKSALRLAQGVTHQQPDKGKDDGVGVYGSEAHQAVMAQKDAAIRPFEEEAGTVAVGEFARQVKEINRILDSQKGLPGVDAVFNLDDEIAAWLAAFEDVVSGAVEALGTAEAALVGGQFAIDRPAVWEGIREILETVSAQTNNTTYQDLADVIQLAETDGVGVRELQERINAYFLERMKPYETERIARTTMTGANGLASVEAWEQAGVAQKMWLSELRHNTRDAHRAAHGQIVQNSGLFNVGGEQLRYPGDPRGSGANIINCLCRVVPVISDEASGE
ncbi:MAG: phage portal protein [Anaerolineae bacterium]|nr:phage portal protein [Anaerolineae bacterium]